MVMIENTIEANWITYKNCEYIQNFFESENDFGHSF